MWKFHLDEMSYKEAMDKYGTDKPDTRFGMELKDISSLLKTVLSAFQIIL